MGYLIRRIAGDEWQQKRELRLAALADTPIGFGVSHAETLELPDEYWLKSALRDAADPNGALYIALDEETGEWVGMAGGFVAAPGSTSNPAGDSDSVCVYSVFVRPEHRGRERAVNVQLVDAVVAWARDEHPASGVILSVHQDNDRAHAFYRRYGFVDNGSTGPYELDENAVVVYMDYRPSGR